jgi:hypothetical protein
VKGHARQKLVHGRAPPTPLYFPFAAGQHPSDALSQRAPHHAPVAQPDRVVASEAIGRGFESLRARHFPIATQLRAWPQSGCSFSDDPDSGWPERQFRKAQRCTDMEQRLERPRAFKIGWRKQTWVAATRSRLEWSHAISPSHLRETHPMSYPMRLWGLLWRADPQLIEAERSLVAKGRYKGDVCFDPKQILGTTK